MSIPINANVTNNFGVAEFIVDSTPGKGTHTTIANAIATAVSGETIFIRPGTYTENLTLKAGVNLVAFDADAYTPNVTIVGTCTFNTAGTVSCSGIRFQTNNAFAIAITGSSASILNLESCYINCTNNIGISYTSSSASSFVFIFNSVLSLATTGISYFSSSGAGHLKFDFCAFINPGNSSTNSTASAGRLVYRFCELAGATTTSSTNNFESMFSEYIMSSDYIGLTIGGSGVNIINSNYIATGTAAALSLGSSVTIIDTTINSSNSTAVITGAGTLNYSGLSFMNTGNVISTTTQVSLIQNKGGTKVTLPAGNYTVLASDEYIGATSSAARAITLPASPARGQTYIIKDITGSASSNNITISGNGNNILGLTSSSTYVIATNYGSAKFIYNGTTWDVV